MDSGLGEALSLASAATWAVGVILARQLGAHIPPLALALLKNGMVLMVLLPLALLLHGHAWPTMAAAQWAWVLLSGVLGIAVADTLYFRALNELGAGRMGVIGNLYSPSVLLLGYVFLGERLGGWQWLGFALVALGVLLVARPPSQWRTQPRHGVRGVLIGMLSIALMAIAIVMVKQPLEQHSLIWITVLRLLGAVAGLAVLSRLPALRSLVTFDASQVPWPRLWVAALLGQGVSMLLWLGGYKYTSASIAAILNESASVFLVMLGAWWLREPVGRRAWAGVVLTFTGIACMLSGRVTL
ncbi:DMT family transporter [Pseudoxanthomonas dokdonensis]|uniref:DMT family transporter n=1 Tax=Pseudoxanthomonas dokdonensis TaxID=344882 RepID=UPI000A5D7D3C|nr:DMT family transporter [Pseudoxanthomonas dokdonensis]